MTPCQWKISMLHFLKKFIVKKIHNNSNEGAITIQQVTLLYLENYKTVIKAMKVNPEAYKSLETYLNLEED